MSFFIKQVFSSASLRPCQPCRPSLIVKFLSEPKRVNCSAQLPSRLFNTGGQCRPNLYRVGSRPYLAKVTRHQQRNSSQKTYFQDPEPPQWQPPPVATGTLVVGSIVGACVGLFYWNGHLQLEASKKATREAGQKANDFLQHFVMSARSLEPGQYYTLISSAFMHRDVVHLALCMLGLYSFGRTTVMMTGIPSFLVLYFGSAVAGGVAQVKFWERTQSPYTTNYGMGSSGAISGLFAATACAAPWSRILLFFIPMPMVAGAVLEVVISVGGMQGRWLQGWGHADHLGGMAFGAIWWLLAMRRGAPLGRLFIPRY
ncbi:rhomboid-domain-containing protein [Cadophora sp. DSE1049]|nr:rhomboid-domain-containing protein [Cadophora sp. DSE1049]